MKLTKEQLKPLGGLLLHGSINCLLAAATGGATPILNGLPSIIATLGGAITGNLASNHMATLSNQSYEKIIDKLNVLNPDNVNHDLERLFRGAAVLSLEFIKTLFLKEVVRDERIGSLPDTDRKKFLADLTLFFDENISDLRMVTKDDKTSIDKSLVKNPAVFLNNMVAQIFRITSVEFDTATEEQIRAFYASKLPYCFELAFKEALKNDDHGFKAFQIWILEEARDQNTLILKDTHNILKAIENISQSQNLIAKDQFDDIINTHTQHIYHHLQTAFGDIKSDLEKITLEINQNYDRLYKLSVEHYDVSKQNNELIKQMIGLLEVIIKNQNNQPSYLFPHELNLIPRHTDEFIGRENELITLKQQLNVSSKVVLVNGIGGIGKTTLAKNFVANNTKEYNHIAWVEIKQNDAQQNNQDWSEAFIGAFAYDKTLWQDGLHLPIDDKATLAERFNSIIFTMKNLPGKNLLVIDNAGEEIKQFNKILPSPPLWHVLVTSRNVLNGFTPFHLDKLEKPKAIQLFKRWYEAKEEEIIPLLEEIEYHTLMIEMLAKTLSASRGRLTIQYITEQLQTGHLDDSKLQKKIELSHTVEETNLFKHLLLTFRFSQLDETVQFILKNFYFLLPQYYTLDGIFYLLGINEDEKDKTIEYLDELAEKGWLNREGNSYSMHRLIQQAVFYQLNPAIKDAEKLISSFIGLTYTDAYTDKISVFQYIPFAENIINKFIGRETENEYLTSLLNNLGALYSGIQQYQKAEEAYGEALKVRRRLAQENPAAFEPDVAMILNNLGVLYRNIQQYQKAEEAYGEALKVRRRLAQENPAAFETNVASTLNNLGNLYRDIQQYQKAEEAYGEVLSLYRRLAQENPAAFEPNVAATLNNLGVLYRNIQQYQKAEEAYGEALQVRRRLAQENPAAFEPDVAATLNNLGNLYRGIQQYQKAEEAYGEALSLYRRLAQENPAAFEPDVAMILNNLGNLYRGIQQYQKAEEAYGEALQVRRRLAQDNPAAFEPDVAGTLNNLGALYSNIQQYQKAEEAYGEALQVRRRLAQENPAAFETDVAATLNNLGALYSDIQQYQKAEEAYGEALSLYRRLAQENPAAFEPDVAMILNNLGNLYSDIQQYQKAEEAYGEALKVRRRLAQDNPAAFEPNVASTLNNLGALYSDIQQYQKAEEAYGEALSLYRRLAQENPAAFEPDVAMILNNLGNLYSDIQQYQKAEEAYGEALQVRAKFLISQPFLWDKVVSLYLILADIYTKLNRREDSIQCTKWSLVILKLYCPSQEKANPFIKWATEMIAGFDLDFDKFWEEEVVPEVNKIRNG